ncbi:MAG: glycerophosphodiester phosphodiesterase family protein, partial [Rhodothermales bacterium]
VHVWTFRNENFFLPADLRKGDAESPEFLAQHGNGAAEYRRFIEAGVDGVFTDFPQTAIFVRRRDSE